VASSAPLAAIGMGGRSFVLSMIVRVLLAQAPAGSKLAEL
jgi:hypothetical protein